MTRRTTTAVLALPALALALFLAGCGGDDTAASETAATAPTETTAPAPTETTESETTDTETETAPARAPAVQTVRIAVEGGKVVGGTKRPSVRKGDRVVLVVRSDAGEFLHLHGYDKSKDMTPGRPTRIAFTATIPGRFELEMHNPSVVVAEVEVRP